MKWEILIKQITHFQIIYIEQITKTIKYYSSILIKGK
jgi:hypothetical protein